ncbi:prepilin peptidase [bacterium]|nr:MAG: prepilin peptidase [bacterium]
MAAFLFILGTAFGSFLNVLIFRLPKGISIVSPRSFCPSCGKNIPWYDNIPILSYILLRGKCRNCGAKISIRYPLVEGLTGVLFLTGYLLYGLSLQYIEFLVLVLFLIPISFIDLDTMLIPDVLSIPGLMFGLLFALLRGRIMDGVSGALAGASIIALLYFVGKLIYKKEAMGIGDIQLAALIGAFTGWKSMFFTLFIASFTGAVYGLIAVRGKKEENIVPFAPFLSLGAVVAYIWGKHLLYFFSP